MNHTLGIVDSFRNQSLVNRKCVPLRSGAPASGAGTDLGDVTMSDATKKAQPLNASFTAVIQKDGSFPTFVELVGSDELLGTRRAVKVEGTIDGHQFAATLMPSGRGPHWLPLRAAICKDIGKSQAGKEVAVHLQQRFS